MFYEIRPAGFDERRRELLSRCDEQRRALERDLRPLREAAAWVDTGWQLARQTRPLWKWLAPVAGFAVAWSWRRRGNAPGKISRLAPWLQLAQTLLSFWKSRR